MPRKVISNDVQVFRASRNSGPHSHTRPSSFNNGSRLLKPAVRTACVGASYEGRREDYLIISECKQRQIHLMAPSRCRPAGKLGTPWWPDNNAVTTKNRSWYHAAHSMRALWGHSKYVNILNCVKMLSTSSVVETIARGRSLMERSTYQLNQSRLCEGNSEMI